MTTLATDDATTAPAAGAEPTDPQPERFPWLPILVLSIAWFLAVAIGVLPDARSELVAAAWLQRAR